jgi:SNF2 family DNA or RNA helicase
MTPDSTLIPEASGNSLQEVEWQPLYSHEDGNLVRLFFTPALSRACLYQRVTGYFSAGVSALAARGLDALIARGGKMQLIVGCTLGEHEIRQIEKGYKLREILGTVLPERMEPGTEHPYIREKLGWLSWMIANNCLDIKIAVPKDADGNFHPGLGLYHAKSGILTDLSGDRVVFTGSLNETESGWTNNCESFSVSCSWRGQWDSKRIEKAAATFAMLWTNTANSAEVIEFPHALREKFLQYMPGHDFPRIRGPKQSDPEPQPESSGDSHAEPPSAADITSEAASLSPQERRRLVWTFIKNAPKRPDGVMIAVKTSTVTPWPHQLRAYKRMLDEWPFRLLIADEVGLGKTIEAGMIIRHAWISQNARRICIMVPGSVCRQWQAELYEKFNLLVPIYTGKTLIWPAHYFCQRPLEEKIDRARWTQQPLIIVSSHLVKRTDRQQEMTDAQDWDLLVLDEAHHARRQGAGTSQEKGPNRLLDLMKRIKNKAKSLLLLTATPMQVHPVEIWDLLRLLGIPPEWNAGAFLEYFEILGKNPDEIQLRRLTELFQAAEKFFGPFPDPEIRRIAEKYRLGTIEQKKLMKALRETKSLIPLKRLSVKQRKAGLAILRNASPVRFRMSRHTRNLLRAYHKNGLLDSPIAERSVRDIAIYLTPAERSVYEAVEDYISTAYQMADSQNKTAVGFIMTVYRRRLASSFHALRRTLEARLRKLDRAESDPESPDRLEEDRPQDERDEILSAEEIEELENKALAAEEKEAVMMLLKSVAKLGTDSKALRLIEELKSAFSAGYDAAIIFTLYADTMNFLKDFVADRLDLSIGCYSGSGGLRRELSGGWAKCSKEQIKRLLRRGEIRILICTDAAGEGLNLQYCGVLVNYDLPWNPMKVEQRIGRIDRIGQTYEKIQVINLAYADTVEADVYFALSERIGLFNGVVGKLQPILSRIPKAFEAAVLNPSEHRERIRQETVSAVHQLVDEAASEGFDIDEVSEAELNPPQFPDPPYLPSDLETLLNREDLLPPGTECKKLDAGAYALIIPGYAEQARVTASPSVFDEHFESHQLFCQDSPLFSKLCAAVSGDSENLEQNISNLKELFLT